MDQTQPLDQPDPLVGQNLPGGLRVLERLGTTVEGALYRARYSTAGSDVALTLLRPLPHSTDAAATPPLNPGFRQKLRQACRIRHPNVASLLEVGETPGGIPYAVGEFLRGELLSSQLTERDTLPLWEAVDLCLQAAAGLTAAHRVGISHGEVAP